MQYNHDRLDIVKRRPKKYSFQLATERRQWWCIPDRRWQAVPHMCRSHWEGTITECWTPGGRYHQHGWVSWAQTTSSVDVRCPVQALSKVVLCDTHDTSILIVDTYVTIPVHVSPRSRYTAVYRSSTKYRETAQISRGSTIPCSSYQLATCTLQACDAETNSKVAENHNYHSTIMSARAAVNKCNPISYFCISAALLTTLTTGYGICS